jgi:hypothetical protein
MALIDNELVDYKKNCCMNITVSSVLKNTD